MGSKERYNKYKDMLCQIDLEFNLNFFAFMKVNSFYLS